MRNHGSFWLLYLLILVVIFIKVYPRTRRVVDDPVVAKEQLVWPNPLEKQAAPVEKPRVRPTQGTVRPEYLQQAHKCMRDQLATKVDRDVWEDFSKVVKNCTPYDEMRIKIYSNAERYNYFQRPARYDENPFLKNGCNLVTIGTSEDMQAELSFSKDFPACKFLGADPKPEKERQYVQVGKFVNQLITLNGTTAGNSTAIGIVPFFTEHLQESKIVDALWMDNEYEEYDLLPAILRTDPLFQAGYRICQLQVEVHGHLEKPEIIAKWARFVRQLFDEGRYLPVHSMQSVHIRTFLFNFGDDECFTRFVETFSFDSDEFYPINE
ncbi:unnamed protein product, partial [Mesorhabditis spiculigera]